MNAPFDKLRANGAMVVASCASKHQNWAQVDRVTSDQAAVIIATKEVASL